MYKHNLKKKIVIITKRKKKSFSILYSAVPCPLAISLLFTIVDYQATSHLTCVPGTDKAALFR